jgi:hypothetical protein
MAYSDFTSLAKVKRDLGLAVHNVANLFAGVSPILVPSRLQEILKENLELAVAISTEKARLVTAPMMTLVKAKFS